MILHPDLRALRGNDAPQRQAQAQLIRCIAEWKASPGVHAILAELDAFADFAPIEATPALGGLFAQDCDDAMELAQGLAGAVAAALATAPLAQVPLRHFTDGTVSTLLLARERGATLSLVAIDGAGLRARPAPTTVDFGPSETWERLLNGRASADLIECRSIDARNAVLDRRTVTLAPEGVIHRDGRRTALLLHGVEGCLVSLRLQRRRAQAEPTREYALADGALVHQAAGDPRDSRLELTVALLARMGRIDAAPLIAAIARETGSTALRWQALRECLALDTGEGFAALCAVAEAPSDPLAASAGALRAQLIDTYPQLARLEPCPA